MSQYRTTATGSEHRHSVRIPLHGVAHVERTSGEVSTCTLRNLSLGGALLRGSAPTMGERVVVCIQVLDHPDITIEGRVVRATAGRQHSSFALAFQEVGADVEDAIHDLSVRVLERSDDLAVLVVHRLHHVRAALVARLAAGGWRVLEATSPLHALAILDREGSEIQWVVVGGELTQTSGLDLLQHIAIAHPTIGRVLVQPSRVATYVAARERADGVAEVLSEPVDNGALEATVGASPRSALRRP